jgi:hypothetical protein
LAKETSQLAKRSYSIGKKTFSQKINKLDIIIADIFWYFLKIK